jgi:hypothetical protein
MFKGESIFPRSLAYWGENQRVIKTKPDILSAPDKQLEASIPKNRVEPWVKLPRHVELTERLISIEKRLLDSIEGILTIGKDSQGMSHRLDLVPLDKVAKRVLVTCLAPFNGNWVIHLPSS